MTILYPFGKHKPVADRKTLQPLFIGLATAFQDDGHTLAIAVAIHDSVYLHDFSVQHINLEDHKGQADPIADFIIDALRQYEHNHLCKWVGGGVPLELEKLSPTLCSRLWSELDLVPISMKPDVEAETHAEDFTFWHARGVDEQADSLARKSIMYVPHVSE
jgi:hypothetical protein